MLLRVRCSYKLLGDEGSGGCRTLPVATAVRSLSVVKIIQRVCLQLMCQCVGDNSWRTACTCTHQDTHHPSALRAVKTTLYAATNHRFRDLVHYALMVRPHEAESHLLYPTTIPLPIVFSPMAPAGRDARRVHGVRVADGQPAGAAHPAGAHTGQPGRGAQGGCGGVFLSLFSA